MACPTVTACLALGGTSPDFLQTEGVVVPITNGTPGATQVLPETRDLYAASCTTTTTCLAVGVSRPVVLTDLGPGALVPIVNGEAGPVQLVAGNDGLLDISCLDAATCLAVGSNTAHAGVIVPIQDGVAGAVQVASGTIGLSGVACVNLTTCEAVGVDNVGGAVVTTRGVIVPVANGTPGPVQELADTDVMSKVACPGPSTCIAVGYTLSAPYQGVVVSIATGAVAPATATDVTVTPSAPTVGTPITFAATVGPVGVGVASLTGTIAFFIDGSTTPAATVALVDGDASFTASGFSAGSHTVTAAYEGDFAYAPSVSAPTGFVVTQPPTTTTPPATGLPLTGANTAHPLAGVAGLVVLALICLGGLRRTRR